MRHGCKAVVFSDEPFWAAEDALAVVDDLAAHGAAVVGAEVFQGADKPRWVASSDYAPSGPHFSVSVLADDARQFIARFTAQPNAFFTFTWIAGDREL